MSGTDLEYNTQEAVDFLLKIDPKGPWTIVAIQFPPEIDPRPKIIALTPKTPELLYNWLEARQGKWNLYFVSNRCNPEVTTSPKFEHMTRMRMLHVDLDMEKGVAPTDEAFDELLGRIRSFDPPPTFITFTGGGYQGGWLFPEELPDDEYGERVEAANQAIEHQIGGDNCHNRNRLLRLPGTINILSPRKIKAGRIPGRTRLVYMDLDTRWSFAKDPIPRSSLVQDEEGQEGEPLPQDVDTPTIFTVDLLPAALKKVIKSGDASEHKNDRSRLIWYIINALIRKGWPDEAILPILLDTQYGCSAHCRDQSNPERYAQKQIFNAHESQKTDWVRDEKYRLVTTSQANFLRSIQMLGINFAHNEFEDQFYINGIGPARPLVDAEINALRLRIDREHQYLPNKDLFFDVVSNEAWSRKFDPIVKYLDTVEWDHKPRLGGADSASWLTTYGGAADNEYTRAVGRLALIAAVRRARSPGCKHDEILVLVSEKQGTNKSSALRMLAKNDAWFSDSLPLHADEKKVIEQTKGKWIIECSELAGMKQGQVEEIKALLSRQADTARPAFGKLPQTVKRRCVFFGTTNTLAFLRDPENRRFWPVVIIIFDLIKLQADVDQLWAEAAYYEKKGESIELSQYLWPVAAEVQLEHKVEDQWSTLLGSYLNDFDNCQILTEDLWRIIGKPIWQIVPSDNSRLSDAMRELGWRRAHMRFPGNKNLKYGYKKGVKPRSLDILYVTKDQNSGEIYVNISPREDQYETKEQANQPYKPPPDDEVQDKDIPF